LDLPVASTHVTERNRKRLPRRGSTPASGESRRLPAWMTFPTIVLTFAAVLWFATLVWLEVVYTIRDPKPIRFVTPPRVTGVVWGRRVFTDVPAFRKALAARGVRYESWARKHRDMALLLRRHKRHR
jgi:hypothetical protein